MYFKFLRWIHFNITLLELSLARILYWWRILGSELGLGEGRTKIVLEIMPTERNIKTACLLSNHSSLLLSKCKQYTLADQIWIFRFLNLSVRQSIRVQTISVPRSSKLNLNFKKALCHGFFNEYSSQIYFLHTAFTDLNSKQSALKIQIWNRSTENLAHMRTP